VVVCSFCVRKLLKLLEELVLSGLEMYKVTDRLGNHVTAVLRKTDMVAALLGLSIACSFSVSVTEVTIEASFGVQYYETK